VKVFDESSDGICQRRASQAYLYYQDEDKVWIKEQTSASNTCEVEVIDYSIPRDPIPDPVEPVKPPSPPVFIMEGGMAVREPRPMVVAL